MKLFRTDRNTGRTFKRTGSNFPHGSKQRARAYRTKAFLDVLKEASDHGPISSHAVFMTTIYK